MRMMRVAVPRRRGPAGLRDPIAVSLTAPMGFTVLLSRFVGTQKIECLFFSYSGAFFEPLFASIHARNLSFGTTSRPACGRGPWRTKRETGEARLPFWYSLFVPFGGLLQQLQDALRHLVGLSQHGLSGLDQDVVLGVSHHLVGHVGVCLLYTSLYPE